MKRRSVNSSFTANSVYASVMRVEDLSPSNSTRSILLMATMTCRMPSSEAMKLCRLVCRTTPFRASTRMMATSQVDAPVAMLRVYCSCPGVSAMMNLRRAVEK